MLQHWGIRLLLGIISLLAGIGSCFTLLLVQQPLSAHGGAEPTPVIAIVLLGIATCGSIAVLVLYFRQKRPWRQAMIAAGAVILAIALIIFCIIRDICIDEATVLISMNNASILLSGSANGWIGIKG
jgi:hypothetical protein